MVQSLSDNLLDMKVYNEMMDIFTISEKVVSNTKAFSVNVKMDREWRMSILSVAKMVQDQYNILKRGK